MAAGKYRERAIFERLNAEAIDAYGQPHNAWEPLLIRWGDLRETPGRERVTSGAVSSVVTATLRVRYSVAARAILPADRVTIRGNDWNIRSVTQVTQKSKQIEMLIERGVSS